MRFLRRYRLATISVLIGLCIVLIFQSLRTSDFQQRTFRAGYEEVPPSEFSGKDGAPKGAVIDVMREAARRRGIRLVWVHSVAGSERSLSTGETELWPIFSDLPWRRSRFSVSRPYAFVRYRLVVDQDSLLTSTAQTEGRIIAVKYPPGMMEAAAQWFFPQARFRGKRRTPESSTPSAPAQPMGAWWRKG